MNCPRCGTSNVESVANCVRCGAALVPASDADTFAGASMPPLPPSANVTPAPRRMPVSSSMSNAPTAGPWAVGVAPGQAPDEVDFGPRYRIERLLGEGGMGAVYRAHDKELDRTVALKLIRPGLALDPAVAQRFKQELLLASKISHKNILRIHDLGDSAGMKFISMAYVEGEDLHQLLTREGKLPLERALHFARQLCAALQAAHGEGVVHRDFKPQNILLDKNENVYVSDFGLSKSLENDTGMTRSGEFLGTPRYMAPEQVEGKNIDHRVDLYALGLILYEMVTGDVPFHADSTLQLMYKRVHEAPKNPKSVNPDLPDWIVRVIMKCLERDPEQRYPTAAAILHDLETGSAPVGSRSMQITLPTVEVTTNKLWIAAGALVLVIAALFAIPGVRHRVFGGNTGGAVAEGPSKFIAVLPFRVMGEQGTTTYLAEGITDALYAKFYGLKDVQIASPAAIQKVSPDDPMAKIARKLGVTLLVTGSLQTAGDKVRVIINLDDTAQNKRLFTQEFSGVQQDLLTLEDQMFSKLFNAIEGKDTAESLARTSLHPTENFAAYELYLKGRSAMRSQLEVKNVEAAIKYYEDALKRDPNFALAYTGIADASLRIYKEKKDASWAERALSAAQQAQHLNESLPEVHFALGSAFIARGMTGEAIAELRRAVELAPTSDEGYRRLGDAYRASGSKEDALTAYRKAVQLNQYYWFNYNALGSAYLKFGDTANALAAFQKVTELEPENAAGYRNAGVVYFQLGQWDKCVAAFQKSLEFEKHFATYSNLGTAFFYLKRYDDAAKNFEQAIQINPTSEDVMGNLGDAYRWSGRVSEATATYDKALALCYKLLAINSKDAATMGHMAQYYSRKGDLPHAFDFIRRARSIDPKDVKLIYIDAQVNAAADRFPEAMQALEESLRKGYSAREAQNDLELQKLQSHKEFASLLKQYEGK